MALNEIPGREAIAMRKSNRFSGWGNRMQHNRVEPVAEPIFEIPFTFDSDAPIFTIGPCFARMVEAQLVQRGYRVPMRDLLMTTEFEGLDFSVLNNFGTPSIYYELAWAFDELTLEDADLFAEIADGRYIDLQLINAVKPASLAVVKARRIALKQAVRALADCQVLIMTLGLVEVWWDEKSQTYLNVAPLPSLIERDPDRFSLCILDFEECNSYLEKAIDVALRNGRPDLQILLTVSPVPMTATHVMAT